MIYMLNANASYIPLADRSVQMIATSPPYYGLRSYHTEPQIWPNGEKPCAEHEWGDELLQREADGFSRMKWSTGGDPAVKREYQRPSQGCICHRCGAWRGELGLEPSPDLYIAHIVSIARELWRVLKDNGTFWLNLGDSYASGKSGRDDSGDNGKFGGPRIEPVQRHAPPGLKPKDLCMIPARVAIALQADGWYLRSEIIWHKPNPMPESVTDRPTRAHEMIYLLTKSARYFYDAEAIAEPTKKSWNSIDMIDLPGDGSKDSEAVAQGLRTRGGNTHHPDRERTGRNRRDVWTVSSQPYSGAHFATWPQALVEPMILAGSRRGDIVLDPFAGSGTTLRVALQHGRRAIGLDLNPDYIELQNERTSKVQINLPLG